MLIEALEPMKIRLPTGEIRQLVVGQPVDLPDPQACKLLALAVGRVRVVASSSGPLQAGQWVHYESPLFGLLAGEVLDVHLDGFLEVFHPVTEKLVRIPVAWVREINENQR